MKTIRVHRRELLTIVKNNREQHRTIFLEAQEGYRATVIATLDKMLADASAGKRVPGFWQLPAPVDQTKEYDRVLRMLEMSTDDVIELTETDFARYVMDDWEWRQNFLVGNAAYSATAARLVDKDA